jgi:uroporphyrinogen-III synthase
LPGIKLAPPIELQTARAQLQQAMTCDRVIFTSPAAVRYARLLQPLTLPRSALVFAPGRGTSEALRREGLVAAHPPAGAMNSEGLLAMPAFATNQGTVGIVTAPDGRGVIDAALRARGFTLHAANVYRRIAPPIARAAIDALRASSAPRALLLTSAEALRNVIASLPQDARARLRDSLVIASSERLSQIASDLGFRARRVGTAPDTASLLDTLAAYAKHEAIR